MIQHIVWYCLLQVENERKENVYNPETTMCVGLARIGSPDQIIKAGTMVQLLEADFGSPLHSLVICGNLHVMEEEALSLFKVNQASV